MSAATEQRADASQQADASAAAQARVHAGSSQATDADPVVAPAPAPFTMVTGDPNAMICEGDVCYIPGASASA